MKNLLLLATVVLLVLIGLYISMDIKPVEPKPIIDRFPPKYYTEDMASLSDTAKIVQIVFVDSVDGRPTYNVLFPDSTVIDSMYPEEIANGLITGKWDYNEDFRISRDD